MKVLQQKSSTTVSNTDPKIRALERKQLKNDEKFKDSVEGYDYVVCKFCGLKTSDLSSHLKIHNIKPSEYKETYNLPVKCQKISEQMSGSNNPAYQHGGKFSPFSKKFVKGDITEETKEKAKQSREANNGFTTRLSYWTERYGEEEGKILHHERQQTFTLEKCIERYGEEEGKKVWQQRQDKWQNTLSNLPESEIIRINAKKGFWRHTIPANANMDIHDEFNQIDTKLYVIEYHPTGHDRSYIKVGVTSNELYDRFKAITIKNVLFIHNAKRLENYQYETAIKKFIFENNLNIMLESQSQKFDGWTECVEFNYKQDLMDKIHEIVG